MAMSTDDLVRMLQELEYRAIRDSERNVWRETAEGRFLEEVPAVIDASTSEYPIMAPTLTSPEKPEAKPLEAQIAEAFMSRSTRDIERYERDTITYREHAQHYAAQATSYRNEARAFERRARELRRALAKSAQGEDLPNKVVAGLKALKKHAAFDSVSFDGLSLHIKTRLLFASIRTGEGQREHVRRCIGAYMISLRLSDGRIRIENLLYSRHWSVSDGNGPCLGEWEPEVKRLYDKCDIYGLFDMFTHYLRAADTDAAAFMTSDYWVRHYRRVETPDNSSESFTVGDCVVYKHTEPWDGLDLYGCVGVVSRVDRHSCGVVFKESNNGYKQYGWIVPPGHLSKIALSVYEASTFYDVETPRNRANVALDKLPDGSTLEDANTLVKAIRGGIKLTPRATSEHDYQNAPVVDEDDSDEDIDD